MYRPFCVEQVYLILKETSVCVAGDNKSFAAQSKVLVTKSRFRGGMSFRSVAYRAAKASCERVSAPFGVSVGKPPNLRARGI